MATGDLQDVVNRVNATLPPWFGQDVTPITTGVINAFAEAGKIIYGEYAYSVLQTRIKSATDTFLDLISQDFFGNQLPRFANESDSQFRNRILINLIRIRGTRQAIIQVLKDITGRTPKVFEPQRALDTGGYSLGGWGYGVAGGWGSLLMPYQALCIAYRPINKGVPYVGGYGTSVGAYSTPSQLEWANFSQVEVTVPDSMIYAAIDNVKSAGTVIWTQIQS